MPFTWSVSTAVGSPTLATAWNQFKTNLDTEYTAHSITRPGCVSGAGWTLLPVSTGGSITKAQIDQIRAVIDHYYDNATHCTTFYSDAHSTNHPTHNLPVDTHNTDYNASEDVGYLAVANLSQNTLLQTTDYSGDYSTNCPDNNGTYCTGLESDANSTEKHNAKTGYYAGYSGTTYGTVA